MSSGGGSGGSAGYRELMTYQQDIHGLLLGGKGGDGAAFDTWTGDVQTYSTDPSALGFLKERGLTDVGGNPYEGVSTYDPDDEISDIAASIEEFKTKIDLLDEDANFTTDMAGAKTEYDLLHTADYDVDSAVASVVSYMANIASTQSSEALTKAATDVIAQLDAISTEASAAASTTLTAATSASRAHGVAERLNVSDEAVTAFEKSATSALQQTKTALVDAYANHVQSHSESLTETADVRSAVEPAIDSLYSLASSIASAGASQVISQAYTSALNVIDESTLNAAVAAYERAGRTQHLRGVSRMAGGMADINAVQTSTFIIGLALLESDFSADVNKHRSDLSIQLYRDAAQSFININISMFTEYIKLYIQEVLLNTDVYKSLRNLSQSDLQAFVSVLQRSSAQHMQQGQDVSSLYTNLYNANRAGTINAMVNKSDRHLGLFDSGFNKYLSTLVNVKQAEEDKMLRFSQAGAVALDGRRNRISEFYRDNASLVDQVSKTKIVARSEEYDKNLEFDVRAANWDLDLFQQAANVLGGVTGSVVPNSDRPSRTQNALSIGLSAAGIAATAPVSGAVVAAAGVAGIIAGYNF